METIKVKRIRLLNVPLDCVNHDQAIKIIKLFLIDKEKHQIVFIDRRKLFKARRNLELKRGLREASLILPVSRALVNGGRFLKKNLTFFKPFSFIIQMLTLLEKMNCTVYLLGSKKHELEKTERNLTDSFPGLRVVGRFAGFFSKEIEKDVLVAIKKASPSLILVGNGVPAKDLWILRHKQDINNGIYLWAGDCFDLFSGKKKSSTRFRINKLLTIFSFIYYWMLIMLYKIFKR